MADRYLQRMGDKKDFRRGSAESGNVLSPMNCRYQSNTIKVLLILCVVHQLTQIKVYFKVKTQEYRHFVGCFTIVIHMRKWRSIACIIMVTWWRLFVMQNKACHPLRHKPYIYTKISHIVVHLSIYDIFERGILCCVCIDAHKSRLALMDN